MRAAVDWLLAKVGGRAPDFVIGGNDNPYLLRWWVIPRNRFFNIYLHCFLRSDDDRALHDHPWINASIILRGAYIEHTIDRGGIHQRAEYVVGAVKCRGARYPHRVELHKGACWTLFLTGPVVRSWGFHCPEAGWIPWQRFVKDGEKGEIGAGCNQ